MKLRLCISLTIVLLQLFVTACDKLSGGSSPSQGQISSKAASVVSPAKDEESAAVESLKQEVDEISNQFTKPERNHQDITDHEPLKITVEKYDPFSVRKAFSPYADFTAKVQGEASLTLPGSYSIDGQPQTRLYDIIWTLGYKDSKWQHNGMDVKSRSQTEPLADTMEMIVRFRILGWGLKPSTR